MSTIDKKTLAGLLLGIGAFAVAASRSKRGSQSFFPPPTGKSPKGTDGFTEEQDEIFVSGKRFRCLPRPCLPYSVGLEEMPWQIQRLHTPLSGRTPGQRYTNLEKSTRNSLSRGLQKSR